MAILCTLYLPEALEFKRLGVGPSMSRPTQHGPIMAVKRTATAPTVSDGLNWRIHLETGMPYCLNQLAPGAYDLLLDGNVIGSVVRMRSRKRYTWIAELLEDLPPSKRPSPFRETEHSFSC